MSLEMEQRVKALEHDMKLLKNDIQRSLLDIQEQILVHHFPSLRMDDDGVPPEGVIQSLQAIRERKRELSPA